jgi:membrane associated rhomboid family serine protease
MFIPLYDKVAFRNIRRPVGVYVLIAANVLVFAASAGLSSGSTYALSFGMIPAVVFGEAVLSPEIAHAPALLTPLTSLFFHADVMHLVGNMLFLWVFGDNVEDAMGAPRFIVFYILCGVCASMAHALAMPHSDSPLIGASGAVSGLIAAYLLLHPHVRVFGLVLKWLPVTLPAVYVIAAWILFQFGSALFGGDPNVGWWAHVGGIVAGSLLIVAFKRSHVMLFDRRLD